MKRSRSPSISSLITKQPKTFHPSSPLPSITPIIESITRSPLLSKTDRLRYRLAGLHGQEFWDSLAEGLAKVLDVRYALVIHAIEPSRLPHVAATLGVDIQNTNHYLTPASNSLASYSSSEDFQISEEDDYGIITDPDSCPGTSILHLSTFYTTGSGITLRSFDFEATHAPCGCVDKGFPSTVFFENGLKDKFPLNSFELMPIIPEAYMGVPMLGPPQGTTHKPKYLGHLCVALTKEDLVRHEDPQISASSWQNWEQVEMALRLFAERGAAELLRRLQEDVVRAARRDAQKESLARRDKLASNLSHELRTPLQGMVGLIELLSPSPGEFENINKVPEAMRPALSVEHRGLLAELQRSGQHLVKLIDGMTDYEAVQKEELKIENEWCEGRIVIERVIEGTIAAQGNETEFIIKNLNGCSPDSDSENKDDVSFCATRLEYQVASDVPQRWFIDSARLAQVLAHLLDNALRFTRQGGLVKLNVSIVSPNPTQSTTWPMLTFRISDNGPGISADKIQDIFQPYYQLDTSNIRSDGGQGLGLATALALARLLGGNVWLDSSEVGKGSTFCAAVPLLSNKLEAQSPSTRRPSVSALSQRPPILPTLVPTATLVTSRANPSSFRQYDPSTARKYPITIMVVDDNAVLRQLVVKMLARLGFSEEKIVTCRNGLEALRRLGVPAPEFENFELEKEKDLAMEDTDTTIEQEHVDVDLVFMDCNMPLMDGFEATRRIQSFLPSHVSSLPTQVPVKRPIPSPKPSAPLIVAVTADTWAQNKDKVQKSGVAAALFKPITVADFQDVVEKLFEPVS